MPDKLSDLIDPAKGPDIDPDTGKKISPDGLAACDICCEQIAPGKMGLHRYSKHQISGGAKRGRPPKTGGTQKTPSGRHLKYNPSEVEGGISNGLRMTGTGISLVGGTRNNPTLVQDGVIVAQHAPNLGKAMSALYIQFPSIEPLITLLIELPGWLMVLEAFGMLFIDLAANHGKLPPGMSGAFGSSVVVPPSSAPAKSSPQSSEDPTGQFPVGQFTPEQMEQMEQIARSMVSNGGGINIPPPHQSAPATVVGAPLKKK